MQTFLPYESFTKSAKVLDDTRLKNQANEAQIIWRTLTGYYEDGKGWPNHPATKMWDGFTPKLDLYYRAIMQEIQDRELSFNKKPMLNHLYTDKTLHEAFERPWWLGHPEFHASHRAALLFKDYEYYSKALDYEFDKVFDDQDWDYSVEGFLAKNYVDDKANYWWPTEHETGGRDE